MKKLLLMAVALLGSYAAQAQTIGNEGTAVTGKTGTMTINLNGVSDARDMQFSVLVPTGITLGTVDGSCVADDTDMYDGVAISDGEAVTGGTKYTVVIYSTEAEKTDGGKILNLPVTITSNYAGGYWGSTTPATISDAKFTNDAAEETVANAGTYAFVVGLFGDVDKNSSIGVGDISGVADLVANGASSAYANASFVADTDGNNSIGVGDISAIASYIANGSWPTE